MMKFVLICFLGYVDDVDVCEWMLGGCVVLFEVCFLREILW